MADLFPVKDKKNAYEIIEDDKDPYFKLRGKEVRISQGANTLEMGVLNGLTNSGHLCLDPYIYLLSDWRKPPQAEQSQNRTYRWIKGPVYVPDNSVSVAPLDVKHVEMMTENPIASLSQLELFDQNK
jgi:hypothetical protein